MEISSIDLRDIKIEAIPRQFVAEASSPVQQGLSIQSPALALAVLQALKKALTQRHSAAILALAGFEDHTVRWLQTAPQADLNRAAMNVRVLIPSMYFNAASALHAADFAHSDNIKLDTTLLENYLMVQGAHAAMMWDVCGLAKYDYQLRRDKLDMPRRMGRPPRLTRQTTEGAVQEEWTRLMREQRQAADVARREGEPHSPRSLAEIYVGMHCKRFPNESMAALYNITCLIPTLSGSPMMSPSSPSTSEAQ